MIALRHSRICMLPCVSGVGGMVSFQNKLAAGLAARGVQTTHSLAGELCDAILVVGGTRQLATLWQARRRGIPIVQRLDGMNWLHRVRAKTHAFNTSWRHYLRAEYGNFILSYIRGHLSDSIVYQSEFTCGWWEKVHGELRIPHHVIYNGVDLETYKPMSMDTRPKDRYRLLLVEGSMMGGYEQGLGVAVELASRLYIAHSHNVQKGIELFIVGRVSPEVRDKLDHLVREQHGEGHLMITWCGLVPGEKIPEIDRSAHLLYSADINAACPNSVIEALACGLPVLAFDTGALPELVQKNAGHIVPYGGDPWKLDAPDVAGLSDAANVILMEQDHFRIAARALAEERFGLDCMVDAYLEVFKQLSG